MSDAEPPQVAVPEVIGSEVKLRSYLFEVVEQRLRLADGREIERTSVEHPGAVAIVAIDEQGRWLLVEQYRYAVRKRLLEVPAGTLEAGETPASKTKTPLRTLLPSVAGRYMPQNEVTDIIAQR